MFRSSPESPASFERAMKACRFLVFSSVSFAVVAGISYIGLDDAAERLISGFGKGGATAVTGRLGSWELLLPVVVAVGGYFLFIRRDFFASFMMVVPYVLAAMATGFFKTALSRPEPGDLIGDLGRSFPSGHTAQAAAVYSAVAVLAYVFSFRRYRAIICVAIAFCVIPGISLYLRNSHWLSDFFGGYFIGTAASAFSAGIWALSLKLKRQMSSAPESVI